MIRISYLTFLDQTFANNARYFLLLCTFEFRLELLKIVSISLFKMMYIVK